MSPPSLQRLLRLAERVLPEIAAVEADLKGDEVGRSGRLHRQLLWAQFRKGVPALLDTSVRMKGQFDDPATPAP